MSNTVRSTRIFKARNLELTIGSRTLIMGILNVTPDSFSNGGETFGQDAALRKALEMIENGADIIDIGGESTRPGSLPVLADEEMRRVIPLIEEISKQSNVCISIDTNKSEVAREALNSGAHIINDISAGSFDKQITGVAADHSAGVILMHIKGTPRNMQQNPLYDDVVGEIKEYLKNAVKRFEDAGVSRESILVDPGIGFGKNLEHNLELIRNIAEFREIAAGTLIGTSRKSFIGLLTGRDVKNRLAGTLASVVCSVMYGADVVRVHDVKAVADALKVVDELVYS
ncbi:dihydropteroate synthase [bacterium]|nr:dihydropteroate synthase [bacterium]